MESKQTKQLKIRVTFLDPLLGTASADPQIHEKFIATKSADKAKAKAELEALPAEELIENAVTVFPRNGDGRPILYDYQVRGFLKEALGAIVETGKIELKGSRGGKLLISKYTYKRVIDNYIFVMPREINLWLPAKNGITICTRPLRAQTLRGERIALASSEQISAGTTFDCEITLFEPVLEPLIRQCLDFGEHKGLGQWRNSGKGRFEWVEAE